MNDRKENIIVRVFIGIGVVVLMMLIFSVLSSAYVYFNTGASKKDILMDSEKGLSDHTPKFIWIDDGNIGREMEDYAKARISSDYANAWYYANFAHAGNYSANSEMFYVDKLAKYLKNIAGEKKTKKEIQRVDIEHEIDFHIYSLDGQIVSFTDSAAIVVEKVFDEAGKQIFQRRYKGVYDVMMLLQDDTWHIKHIVPRKIEEEYEKRTNPPSEGTFFALGDKGEFVKDGVAFQPAGINYYPQAHPWDMWDNFSKDTLEKDFSLIKSLGMNTVRIFIPFDEFGKGHVPLQRLNQLGELLDKAEEQDLGVIVTLFDFVHNYQLSNWSATDRQLETILTAYKEHPAILAWDIKNEPDLDFEHHDTLPVLSWLEFTLERAREYDPNHLVTIGWYSPNKAHLLGEKMDFITFHYYDSPELLGTAIAPLKEHCPDKPLMLGEFGMSTYNSYFFRGGHSEKEQFNYYVRMRKALKENGNMPYLAWTLYDFPDVPSKVVGPLPWNKNPQKKFGIINDKGMPKSAAIALDPETNIKKERVITLFERLLKPFYVTLYFSFFVTTSAMFLLLYKYYIRKRQRNPMHDVKQ